MKLVQTVEALAQAIVDAKAGSDKAGIQHAVTTLYDVVQEHGAQIAKLEEGEEES